MAIPKHILNQFLQNPHIQKLNEFKPLNQYSKSELENQLNYDCIIYDTEEPLEDQSFIKKKALQRIKFSDTTSDYIYFPVEKTIFAYSLLYGKFQLKSLCLYVSRYNTAMKDDEFLELMKKIDSEIVNLNIINFGINLIYKVDNITPDEIEIFFLSFSKEFVITSINECEHLSGFDNFSIYEAVINQIGKILLNLIGQFGYSISYYYDKIESKLINEKPTEITISLRSPEKFENLD